jgi:hypothetical protein
MGILLSCRQKYTQAYLAILVGGARDDPGSGGRTLQQHRMLSMRLLRDELFDGIALQLHRHSDAGDDRPQFLIFSHRSAVVVKRISIGLNIADVENITYVEEH